MKQHEPLVILTKSSNPELIKPTPLSEGQINSYDIFKFLKNKPARSEVINYLGIPDSVWVNDDQTTMVWYFFVEELNDFNAVEINIKTSRVTGFEWD